MTRRLWRHGTDADQLLAERVSAEQPAPTHFHPGAVPKLGAFAPRARVNGCFPDTEEAQLHDGHEPIIISVVHMFDLFRGARLVLPGRPRQTSPY